MPVSTDPVVRYRVWQPFPLLASVLVLAELVTNIRWVLITGGGTVFGWALKGVLAILVVALFHLAATRVRIDEDGVCVGHLFGRARRLPWSEVTTFQVETKRPRLLEGLLNWGQTPITRVGIQAAGWGRRVRVPQRLQDDVRHFEKAFKNPEPPPDPDATE